MGDQAIYVRCRSHSQQMLSVVIHKAMPVKEFSSPPD